MNIEKKAPILEDPRNPSYNYRDLFNESIQNTDLFNSFIKNTEFKQEFKEAIYSYTKEEILTLFSGFSDVQITPFLTEGDLHRLPKWLVSLLPNSIGWFIGIRAKLGQKK